MCSLWTCTGSYELIIDNGIFAMHLFRQRSNIAVVISCVIGYSVKCKFSKSSLRITVDISINQLQRKKSKLNVNPHPGVVIEIQIQMQDWHLLCIFAVLKQWQKATIFSSVS